MIHVYNTAYPSGVTINLPIKIARMFTTEVVITEDEYGFKIRPAEIDDSKSFKLTGDRNTQVTFSSATAKEKIGDHDYEIDNEVLTLTKR